MAAAADLRASPPCDVAFKPESEVLLSSSFGTAEHNQRWADAFREHGLTVKVFPVDIDDSTDLSRVEFASVYDPPPGLLARCPNLRLIHCMGAGASPGMLADERCPSHLPLLRIVDPLHAQRMSTFVLGAIIAGQRHFDDYLAAQRDCRWDKTIDDFRTRDVGAMRVGVMGYGPMGAATAQVLRAVGYPVSVWTRTPRQLEGFTCFHGREQLRSFVADCRVLVCLVPLTPDTRGVLDAELFSWLPQGAQVISVSRGAHLVEADLLAALDSGHLSSAVLDVFAQEPLPPESPLWQHPKIRVFPHIAGTTPTRNAVALMVANRERCLRGQPLPQECVIDRTRGY